MKKNQLIYYLAFIMSIMTMQAQTAFCEQFDQHATTSLMGLGCPGVPVNNVLNNWGTINTSIKYEDVGSQNGPGDVFLFMDDGSCGNGASWIYNSTDYSGDWTQMVQGDGCFCYDFKTFHIATGTLSGNSLRIYNGTDPANSTLIATFVLNVPINSSLGWVRICAPIDFSDSAGNLPSNADGQWTINTGLASDWDTLISGVNGIGYLVDVAGGDEKFGIDNICISDICDSTLIPDPEPTNDGAYCCEVSDGTQNTNLVQNGNFEFGNTSFSSSYTVSSATYPGEYDVVTSASNFNATINDHSNCQDPTNYQYNDMFMVVNGKTQQPSGTTSVIWEQTISIQPDKNYKLCANFKNMPQCTFDILPEIQIEINGFLYGWEIINADPSDPCDWIELTECFVGDNDQANIKIHLKEDGNGDGNDLAIDDISVQEKLDQNLSITVQHQGNPQQIIGSVNTISNTDDAILIGDECSEINNGYQYYWFVYELTTYPFNAPIDFINMAPNSWSWSSNLGGFSTQLPPATSTNPVWNLTTNFPNYYFDNNKLYVIGMYVPSCCDSCYDEAWTYQLTFNSGRIDANNTYTGSVFTQEVREYLKSMFREFGQNVPLNNNEGSMYIYPNPSNDIITIHYENNIKSYEIYDTLGKRILSKVSDVKQIDISNLQSNMYFITVKTEDGKKETLKFIKK
ncbi:T9SS type A sorting domain-containing protein [Olleya aquimaris]|nr:T9SS type A sorting domain-containing protein [Olleya aquimaris]